MTSAPPNYMFGIMTNLSSSTGYHVFGAIFKLNADGKVEDFTPIDFDGKTIREHVPNNFGKAQPDPFRYATASKALFFPITETSAKLMVEELENLAPKLNSKENPYYFCASGNVCDPKLERKGMQPIGYDRRPRDVGDIDYDSFELSPDSQPRAATNCMKFLLNTLEKVGGVPLSQIKVGDEIIPVEGTPRDLRNFIEKAAGNQGKMATQKTKGKLIEGSSGHTFCAYDQGDSDTCITGIVNGLLVDSTNQLKPLRDDRTGKPNEGLTPVTQLFTNNPHPWFDSSLILGKNPKPSTQVYTPLPPEKIRPPRGPIEIDRF